MLAEFEWQQDLRVLCERTEMCELYRKWVQQGYTVVITTDMFYSKKQIADLLAQFDLNGYADIFVSCEYGTGKDGDLFDRVREAYGAYEILHIGDDARKDYTCATEHGLWAAKIASVSDCCEASGMFGMEDAVESATLSDRVKYGMFFAKLFNSPFFEPAMPVHIQNAKQVAYLFCAPIITDFMLWLEPETMADKQLCIESFFASDSKSSIYESYYILETILTALHPQVLAFDESGKPVYAKETRTQEDLECVARMQDAIEEYFAQYLSVVPPSKRSDEKEVSVQLLHAIHHFPMTAEDFLALTVEDPFFNRMTDLRDVL